LAPPFALFFFPSSGPRERFFCSAYTDRDPPFSTPPSFPVVTPLDFFPPRSFFLTPSSPLFPCFFLFFKKWQWKDSAFSILSHDLSESLFSACRPLSCTQRSETCFNALLRLFSTLLFYCLDLFLMCGPPPLITAGDWSSKFSLPLTLLSAITWDFRLLVHLLFLDLPVVPLDLFKWEVNLSNYPHQERPSLLCCPL